MSTLPRRRDRSRRFDIVLFGATGFTGALVAEYLAKQSLDGVAPPVRIALAGRDRVKLEGIRRELTVVAPSAAEWPILLADAHDRSSLDAITREAEVICSTVGPYARHGAMLVGSCVESGTDYCDLTGETQFVRRTIDQHEARAQESGARIVHSCGYDSIPSDLGTLFVQEHMRETYGGVCGQVKFFAGEASGGASGGTIASMLYILEELERDPSLRKVLGDPYALVPKDARGLDGRDQIGVAFDESLGMWTGPFVMAAINTRIVRRSNYLMGFRYGREFRYAESMSTGKGAAGLARAVSLTSGVSAFMAAASTRPLRRWLETRVLPKPGEGPSREAREKGFFVVRLIGEGYGADGAKRVVRARVEGKADPGYGETAKMLGESALCLALDGASLGAPGGIRTPASTMGVRLIERLVAAGMVFRIEEAA